MKKGTWSLPTLTLLATLFSSIHAHAGGLTAVNFGDFGSDHGVQWNTELVFSLGSASWRGSGPGWTADPTPPDPSSPLNGDMRIYMQYDIRATTDFQIGTGPIFELSFSSLSATNPVIGVDVSDVISTNEPMMLIDWTDTTSGSESVFMQRFPSFETCFYDPFTPICIDPDRGNSRVSGFPFFLTIESAMNMTLDLGDIMIHDTGADSFSVDPDFAIFKDQSGIDPSDLTYIGDDPLDFIRVDRSPEVRAEILENLVYNDLLELNDDLDVSLFLYAHYPFSPFGPSTAYLTTADAVVPVPAAVWLMASGLLGLGAFARRRA